MTTLDPSIDLSVAAFPAVGRNRLYNGEMMFDQANGGNAVTVNSNVGNYSLDGWFARGIASAGVFTLQQQSATPPTGAQFYLRAAITTADASPASSSSYYFQQRIETIYSLRDVIISTGNVPLVLSFWARSSLTGSFAGAFSNQCGTANRSYQFLYTITAANTWQKFTIIIPSDNFPANAYVVNTSTICSVIWCLGAGTANQAANSTWNNGVFVGTTGMTQIISTNGATLDLTLVQLETGSGSTPFEYRPYTFELQQCQRYYEKSYPLGTAPGTTGIGNDQLCPGNQSGSNIYAAPVQFRVLKRATPTITIYTQTTGATGQWTWNNTAGAGSILTSSVAVISQFAFNPIQSTDTTRALGEGHWVADARL
jgi:hypothetical protein